MMQIRRHPLLSSALARGIESDEDLAQRLDRSAALVGDPGERLVPRVYERLFARAPELARLFPSDVTKVAVQRAKFAQTLAAVIMNLRNPQNLRTPLRELGIRHERYGARPEHYPILVDELVGAMAEVAGPGWTSEDTEDWRIALGMVCDAMLGK